MKNLKTGICHKLIVIITKEHIVCHGEIMHSKKSLVKDSDIKMVRTKKNIRCRFKEKWKVLIKTQAMSAGIVQIT